MLSGKTASGSESRQSCKWIASCLPLPLPPGAGVRSASVLASGCLSPLTPCQPEWVSASFFVCLVIHTFVFALLLAVLVAALGNIRQSRGRVGGLALGKYSLLLKARRKNVDDCGSVCLSSPHFQGSGYRVGGTYEVFCFKLYIL